MNSGFYPISNPSRIHHQTNVEINFQTPNCMGNVAPLNTYRPPGSLNPIVGKSRSNYEFYGMRNFQHGE